MVKFQIVENGIFSKNNYLNYGVAEAFNVESGKIAEDEMPEQATAAKGNYRVIVFGWLTDPNDPDDPDSEYRLSQIIDEFEIKYMQIGLLLFIKEDVK